MKLVALTGANEVTVWINPETISYLRRAVDGEEGQTIIMFEGTWLPVQEMISEVINTIEACKL